MHNQQRSKFGPSLVPDKENARLRILSDDGLLRVPKAGSRARIASDDDRRAFRDIGEYYNFRTSTTKITGSRFRFEDNRIPQRIPIPVRPIRVIEPQRKVSLIHKLQRSSSREPQLPFSTDVYFVDYMEHIVRNLMKFDNRCVMDINFLRQPALDNRNEVILCFFKMQANLHHTPAMFSVTVRMFDAVLDKMAVPKNMYILVILTLSWIIMKFHSPFLVKAPKLLSYCDQDYTKQQLLAMERKMLRYFDFKLSINEPTVFATYYLRKLAIPCQHQITFCVLFVLESMTLSHHFSSFRCSKIAASAIYLVLKYLHPDNSIYKRLSTAFGYYDPVDLEVFSKVIWHHLKLYTNPNCRFAEIYLKYSAIEWKNASIILIKAMFQ